MPNGRARCGNAAHGAASSLLGSQPAQLLAVALAVFGVRYLAPEPMQVAQITRVDGHLLVRPDEQSARELAVAQSVSTGETIQTDDRSRAALQFGDGLSLRLDRGTIVKIASADELVLTAGAVYVDSQADDPQESDDPHRCRLRASRRHAIPGANARRRYGSERARRVA